MAKVDVYFSLGTNLGDRKANLDNAISYMEEMFLSKAERKASYIETEAWGFESEDKFLNTAVLFNLNNTFASSLEHALDILDKCKCIERKMGRNEEIKYHLDGSRAYSSRIIDIDILYYSVENIQSNRLVIPHASIKERDFVLIPLREIAKEELISAYPYIFNQNY